MDELVDQLTALEENISELDKVAILLQSVQDNYPTSVIALLARILVKQALLEEEQRQSSGAEITKSSKDAALKAGYKGDKRCYKCGKVSHFQRDCGKSMPKHKKLYSGH